jgi:predicted enzyme related to lactoylglutathione lyase
MRESSRADLLRRAGDALLPRLPDRGKNPGGPAILAVYYKLFEEAAVGGKFCWAELATTDAARAKEFYAKLFGWTAHDDPIPGGGAYTMLRLGGGDVGALYAMSSPMHPEGTPAHWGLYVSVDSADAAAGRAKKAGGQVVGAPMDVMDIGRMAALRDPVGAVLSVWQPKKHTGFAFDDGRPGTVCWNELMTGDVVKAGAFYSAVFGWTVQTVPMGPGRTYHLFHRDGKQAAGMMGQPSNEGGAPPHWLTYVAVESCDASTAEAARLGGKVRVPPSDIPGIGRFSVLQDPQGAAFATFQRKA